MAAHELGSAIDDLRAHGSLRQIRKPEHEAPPRLQAVESYGSPQVVCLAGFAVNQRKRFHHLPKMGTATRGGKHLLRIAAISQQADAVAGDECELAHRNRGGGGIVEFGVIAYPGLK